MRHVALSLATTCAAIQSNIPRVLSTNIPERPTARISIVVVRGVRKSFQRAEKSSFHAPRRISTLPAWHCAENGPNRVVLSRSGLVGGAVSCQLANEIFACVPCLFGQGLAAARSGSRVRLRWPC